MKWFKRILKFLLISILLLFVTGALITYVYADEVEKLILNKLSERLEKPVKFEDAQFSLLQKFPAATVGIYNVKAESTNGFEEKLIDVEIIYFSFNWWDIFGNALSVDEVSLENGSITIHQNMDKDWNFELFKTSQDSSTSSSFGIDALLLKNIQLKYQNTTQSQFYSARVASAELNLLQSNDLDLSGDANLVIDSVQIGDWTNAQQVLLETHFVLLSEEEKLTFSVEDGLINKQRFSLSTLVTEEVECTFDLFGADLISVIQVLPPEQVDFANWNNTNGKLSFNGKYSTKASEETLDIDFDLSNGSMVVSKDYPLSDINVEGKLFTHYPSDIRNYTLKIEEFAFDISDAHFSGNVDLENLEKPKFKGRSQGKLKLKDWTEVIPESMNYQADGTVQFNINFNGRYDFSNTDWLSQLNRINTDGDIRLKNVQLLSESNIQIKNLDGLLSFNNKDLKLVSAKGYAQNAQFELKGTMYSYLSTLFEEYPISIAAEAKVDQFDLNEFLISNTSDSASAKDELSIPKKLNFDLDIHMKQFKFNKFLAENLRGNVKIKNQKVILDGVDMKTCDGEVALRGMLDARSEHSIDYECFADLKAIDIKKFFFAFDNFGQDFLLDKHLSGFLTTKIDFLAISDKQLNIDLSKVYTSADIEVVNGELTNFEPLLELQEYLLAEWKLNYDFTHLKFNTIHNQIEIANKKITIPEMDIVSNSFDLKVSGWHTFEHEIQYLLKIKHSEIFKAKSQNLIDSKYGVIEDDGKSATLPLLMSGNVDNPQFSYDFSTKKTIIQRNIKDEKKEVKKAIEKEKASWNKEARDSIKQEEQNQKTKFEVIWDEE